MIVIDTIAIDSIALLLRLTAQARVYLTGTAEIALRFKPPGYW